MHSRDDRIVPYDAAGPLAVKLLPQGTLQTYEDLPHGMPTTHAELVNGEMLKFFRG
jgi:non-heme chloroperoxidase